MSMKKVLSLILASIAVLSLCACGNSSTVENANEQSKTSSVEVKGIFLLDPAEELDLSLEELSPAQCYLLLIYDVTNNSDRNEELSGFANSITITMNNTNTYEQLYSSEGYILKNFREDCGYSVSTDYGILWGGSEPIRMIAAFAVNGNDIRDDCTAEVNFQLSENINGKSTIIAEDIQTINLLDGVFSVEDDSDMYQIAHSIRSRAKMCKTALETASQAEHNGETLVRNTNLALCGVLFSEDTTWGVSCGNTIVSDELPIFNIEAVNIYFPDIVSKIETISDNINLMIEELDTENPNYDNINTAQRLAYNTLSDIIEVLND